MQDPVNSSPAVLIKRYNISQQKELEVQLARQQEALQRYIVFLSICSLYTVQPQASIGWISTCKHNASNALAHLGCQL